MKIVHTADLHIGSALTARLSQEKARQRKNELIGSFERMVEEAGIIGARLFIIAGDMFDTEDVAERTVERILGIIARARGIDFLYLPGNHEKNALVDSGLMLPDNLLIFGKEWTYFDYGEVTVAGRSEMQADMFETLAINAGAKNIVVLHGTVGDRSSAEVVGLKDARERGIDYIALGHYHSYGAYEVDAACQAVYPGTPEGRGFDEAGDKGFVVVDTSMRLVNHRFFPFAKRALRIVEVDVGGMESEGEIRGAATELLASVRREDIVRLEIVGRRAPELTIDTSYLTSCWSDRFFYFEVKDSSRTDLSSDSFIHDKSLKGEFIRLCAGRTDLSDADREEIIRIGLCALRGEDVTV